MVKDKQVRRSRKRDLAKLGMVEFKLAPEGLRVAVVKKSVVGVSERIDTGANIVLLNGDVTAQLSLLDVYPFVIEVLADE